MPLLGFSFSAQKSDPPTKKLKKKKKKKEEWETEKQYRRVNDPEDDQTWWEPQGRRGPKTWDPGWDQPWAQQRPPVLLSPTHTTRTHSHNTPSFPSLSLFLTVWFVSQFEEDLQPCRFVSHFFCVLFCVSLFHTFQFIWFDHPKIGQIDRVSNCLSVYFSCV